MSSFGFIIKQQWAIEEISIFSNSSNLKWRAGLYYTKPGRDGSWVGSFQNCIRQARLPFKMVAVTKNRNFFNCPLLLYYKSK
jgi:hypothetical protein